MLRRLKLFAECRQRSPVDGPDQDDPAGYSVSAALSCWTLSAQSHLHVGSDAQQMSFVTVIANSTPRNYVFRTAGRQMSDDRTDMQQT